MDTARTSLDVSIHADLNLRVVELGWPPPAGQKCGLVNPPLLLESQLLSMFLASSEVTERWLLATFFS